MNFEEYLEEMKRIQKNLLDFLECNDENATLTNIFEDNRFHEDKHELISILHFVLKISNNHHRDENFFSKIEEILQFFKEDIKTKLSNSEIFNIFKSNKKILLFLNQEFLFTFDEQIVKEIIQSKYIKADYSKYFSPEIRPFINEKWFPKEIKEDDLFRKELPEYFYDNRKNGENDSFICEMIQKDSVDNFIQYVNQSFYPLDSQIDRSIYETNNFLLKNEQIRLIEYAAFFGSIQIFQYLRMNKIKLTPSLWLYAIHGKNAEIIHLLEGDNIKPRDQTYKECLIESIKCHHNDIANYILDQHLQNEKDDSNNILVNCLKYFNLCFEQNNLINESSFCHLCRYDYYCLVNFLLKEKNIDINAKTIYITKN
ncbi:hypothetical protein M9Y10_019497 [Tritrichomonas musculus]|uniref:DUF3447 domain-containing protein n=1 Tax=Tritrichomonas musculus TaxID=1915356 RepID=A0ABR2HGL1_9EUKA